MHMHACQEWSQLQVVGLRVEHICCFWDNMHVDRIMNVTMCRSAKKEKWRTHLQHATPTFRLNMHVSVYNIL